jgi:hypothetical protein
VVARWANLVVQTGLAFTMADWLAMTRDEREALVAEANRRG